MESVKESNQEAIENDTSEKIIKPHQEQPEPQQEDNQLQKQNQQQQDEQQQHQQQKELLEDFEEKKEIAATDEKQQEEQHKKPQTILYEGDDDDYDDDDEEKETSQKLVIDIPDDEEEEKEDEEDDNDIINLDDLPEVVSTRNDKEKVSPKPEKIEAIITLSDGEEETASEAVSKPGKVQKRRSMGAGTTNDEEHYRLKRRKINAAGAPKLPLTGYVRYMHDRRDSLRKEQPSKTHMEYNKIIGEEWHSLPSDVKSSYLKAADVDKQRYVKELHSFLKSRPDVLASELAKNKERKKAENNSPNLSNAPTSSATKSVLKEKSQANENSKITSKDVAKDKVAKDIVQQSLSSTALVTEKSCNEKIKRKRTPTPPNANSTPHTTTTTNATTTLSATASTSSSSALVTPIPGEIPIFTNEFLEHNKIYDMEVRSLRKSKTDLELQNSVLEKHVENMKFGVEKMMTENNELEEKNRLLEIYLDKLKRKLALALSALPLPSAPNGATVDNIDKYMQDLYKMSTSNSTGPATLNKAKDIIRKLDLQIQL